ncbi:GNAT family N-acetyltransferase [Jeotgalibacillus sp. ET6]|uniref:GNAT family N-acetyltransferase n=1 Tax=Jeotgalibacillus sp. ET6 TaxID=3037260 RepID=UPI0024186044|nr:GNAT family N-acetyltransferase [Jeotgalibacillus sp. ET6]MDG5471463.1 GNAT family N-acetyltransferase [Jeotgalibacillus sp. ET6]
MKVTQKIIKIQGVTYIIRSAVRGDAKQLSDIRVQIDGETQNMDREKGEAFVDADGFAELIQKDTESRRNLFLVAVVQEEIVGYSRCEGNELKRFAHKVEFGVGVLKDYWGLGIGKNLLAESIHWADLNGVIKFTLNVMESNEKAISLYKKFGFQVEGILKNDKLLDDGEFRNTIVMGRIKL